MIVVGVDGSAADRADVAWAADEAARRGDNGSPHERDG